MAKKWEQPLYPFELPSRKILVNVTRSCPSFIVPAPAIPDVAAELKKQGMTKVLDFGAGKLRNTLYLLGRRTGFRVWAVEFKDCFQTPAGQQRHAQANRYRDFFFLEFPHQFFESKIEVDAVFLVNVANVVPDEDDRRIIVEECTKRLKPGGWFLWMSQYGEPHYKPGVTKRLKAPDGGWFYSLDKDHQTYYKEFAIPEIKGYFGSRKYRELRKINAAHHRAFIFEKL
jgi:SAM-dependent methyltransferase